MTLKDMTLKDQLHLLRELQKLDLELDQLKVKKSKITNDLERNKGFLNKLVEDLELQKQHLEEIKEDERKKMDQLREMNAQVQKRKRGSAVVTSSKEQAAIDKQNEAQQKVIDKQREDVVALVEEINSISESIATKEEKSVRLRESIAIEIDSTRLELTGFDEQINDIKTREEEIRKDISKPLMYKYDFIRGRRPGEAITAAVGGYCRGCNMLLPPQEFIEIQRGEKLITCPSCQRILYYESSREEEEKMRQRRNRKESPADEERRRRRVEEESSADSGSSNEEE